MQDYKYHVALTLAAGHLAAPVWPGVVKAGERALALQLVAQVTVEVCRAPGVQIHHSNLAVVRPSGQCAAQQEDWETERGISNTNKPCAVCWQCCAVLCCAAVLCCWSVRISISAGRMVGNA